MIAWAHRKQHTHRMCQTVHFHTRHLNTACDRQVAFPLFITIFSPPPPAISFLGEADRLAKCNVFRHASMRGRLFGKEERQNISREASWGSWVADRWCFRHCFHSFIKTSPGTISNTTSRWSIACLTKGRYAGLMEVALEWGGKTFFFFFFLSSMAEQSFQLLFQTVWTQHFFFFFFIVVHIWDYYFTAF